MHFNLQSFSFNIVKHTETFDDSFCTLPLKPELFIFNQKHVTEDTNLAQPFLTRLYKIM